MIRRTPLKRVSKKRKQAMVEYRRRRLAFLARHPWCQVYLSEIGNREENVNQDGRVINNLENIFVFCPMSTEIHHTKKPKATYLNDESTWLAVCREMHDKIENNKSWAREKGYLQNI